MGTEDESDDSLLFGQSQALPVADCDELCFDRPAETPEEYLARVRYEASQIPAVVRVEPAPGLLAQARQQAVLLPKDTEIPDAIPELLPKPRWVQDFAAEFSDLRSALDTEAAPPGVQHVSSTSSGLPALGDIDSWEVYAMGSTSAGLLPGDGSDHGPSVWSPEATGDGHPPLSSCLLSMDQVTVSGLLEALLERCTSLPHVAPHHLTLWIFALSARLEKPLTASMEASMRSLVRHTAALRAGMSSPDDPHLPRVNLLMALAGGYFRQDETLSPLMHT